jgi:homospermidine synthase
MFKLQAAQRLFYGQKLASHEGRVLFLGFGAVAQTMLPLFLRHIEVNPRLITVLDKVERPEFAAYANTGIRYITCEIVEQNIDSTLSALLDENDYLINLSLNIDGCAIVEWCLKHNVLYIDTSIERWPTEPDEVVPNLAERTLYDAHQEMRAMAAPYAGRATCVVTHGANPGLVSHFTKAALLKIARDTGVAMGVPTNREAWAELARATGTKVIQVAERDTQVLSRPKLVHEFVNTWSCEGFWAEGRAPAEMGWGTHEQDKPENGNVHKEGPGNAAYLKQPGVSTLVKSWVPRGGTFNGFLIQHSEAITISEYLTTADGAYRPTVYYAYQPCDAALASIHEMKGQNLWMHNRTRIAKNSIVSGMDELGVLLLGHAKTALWYGSQLDIEESRELVPCQNATTVQVCASMLGAIVWSLENPCMGYVEPDAIPFDFVLRIAEPYLGPVVAIYGDWSPLHHQNMLYGRTYDEENPWAFTNFLVC